MLVTLTNLKDIRDNNKGKKIVLGGGAFLF